MTPYYERDGITIYCGDNRRILARLIQDVTIDLTVTSPPYDNLDADLDPIPGGLRTYNGYTWDFKGLAAELWRVTVRGGVVVWVVGDETIDGSETCTSDIQKIYFKTLGFNVHDTMIYEVAGTGAKGSNLAYWQGFEYMLVFAKDKPKTVNRLVDKINSRAGIFVTRGLKTNSVGTRLGEYVVSDMGIRSNIWRYHSGQNGDDQTPHPAPFPESLARDHIISWSNPGDLVCDPFLGSGTTAKMAQQLGRRFVGCEISEDYCRIAVDRLRQPSFFSLPISQPQPQPKPEQAMMVGLD